jgi:O-antigen/teichoic acid export membrane protein
MAELDETKSTEPNGLSHVRHLARQSTLLLSSGVFSYIGAFALNILLARNLGAAGAGAWFIAFFAAQVLATLGLMGTDWIVLRHGSYFHSIGDEARLRGTIRLALSVTGSALTVLGMVLFIAAPLLSRELLETQDVGPLLRLAVLAGALMGLRLTLLAGTQAFKNMRAFALVQNILQPAARLILVAIAIVISPTQFSAFVGLVIAEAFLAFSALLALHRRLPLTGQTGPIERRGLMKFALPVWGLKVIENAHTQLVPLLLGSLTTLSATGAFVASRRISAAPTAITVAMNRVYSPVGSNLYLQGRHEELLALFKAFGKWSFTLGFPLFCLQVAFSKEILSLFGESFRGASTALIVLSVGALANYATGPVSTTLLSAGRSSLSFVDQVIALATLVIFGAWLIPAHGLLGAAIAAMLVSTVNNGLRLGQVWWLYRIHPYRMDYLKPLTAGAVAIVVAKAAVAALGLGITPIAAGVAVASVAVSYIALLVLLGLSDDDRAALETIRRALGRQFGWDPEAVQPPPSTPKG